MPLAKRRSNAVDRLRKPNCFYSFTRLTQMESIVWENRIITFEMFIYLEWLAEPEMTNNLPRNLMLGEGLETGNLLNDLIDTLFFLEYYGSYSTLRYFSICKTSECRLFFATKKLIQHYFPVPCGSRINVLNTCRQPFLGSVFGVRVQTWSALLWALASLRSPASC